MTTISSDNFESKIDHMVKVTKDFHKAYPNVPFSLEYGGANASVLYFTFTAQAWTATSAETLNKLCEEHGVDYTIVPLDGKLAVTLQ